LFHHQVIIASFLLDWKTELVILKLEMRNLFYPRLYLYNEAPHVRITSFYEFSKEERKRYLTISTLGYYGS